MLKIALIGSTGMLGIDVNAALKGVNFLIKNFNSKNLDIANSEAVIPPLKVLSPIISLIARLILTWMEPKLIKSW